MLHIKLHFPYFSFEMAPFPGTFFSFRLPKRSLWQTYLPFHWDVMMWCRPNEPLATLWFWGFWGSLAPHLVGKIHHPWLLYLLWVHILIHEQTYKKNNKYVEIQQFFHQIPEVSCKKVVVFGVFLSCPGHELLHWLAVGAPRTSKLNPWRREGRSALAFQRHVAGWIGMLTRKCIYIYNICIYKYIYTPQN